MLQTCLKCNKKVSPRSLALKCEPCSRWVHVSCTNLSDALIDMYLSEAKSDGGRTWNCNDCGSVGFSAASASARPIEDQNLIGISEASALIRLQATVDQLVGSVLLQNKKMSEIIDRLDIVSKLQEENVALRQTVEALTGRVQALEKGGAAGDGCNVAETLKEIEERRRREKNIIIYDIIESREHDTNLDLTTVHNKLKTIKPDVKVIRAIRLGKRREGHSRPIKIVLDSAEDARYLLAHGRDRTDVRLKSDETPLQRQFLLDLRKKLEERRQSGEQNLTIKYRNSIPTIVKSTPSENH